MDWKQYFLGIGAATFASIKLYQSTLRPFYFKKHFLKWRSRSFLNKCRSVFEKLYADVNAYVLSRRDRDKNKLEDSAFVYGEVTFDSFILLLSVVKPQEGEVFYDLGAGAGKAVFIAALVGDFSRVVGVEKLDLLYELCDEQHKQFLKMEEVKKYFPNKKFNIEFIHDDMLNCDISDADIIFLNATCFKGDLWDSIVKKLKKLKEGARVILTSKTLDEPSFELIDYGKVMMSWGMNSVYMYKKISVSH